MRTNLLRLSVLAVLALAAAVLTACGSDSGSDTADLGPDPASLVPADTPFYMEAVVRPEGQLGDDLESALSKLLVTDDVSGKLQDAIDEGLASEGEDLTYENDIAPWLGSRAGIYFNGYDIKTNEAEGAAVVAITDADAAQSFVDKASEGQGKTEQQDYNGVQVTVDPKDDTAVAIDGDFLLAGTTQGVEDSIDAKDGDNFAGVDDSTTGFDTVPDNTIFTLYADPQGALDLVKSSGEIPADQLKQIEDQLAEMGDGPIDAWGTVTDSSMGFGASAPAADNAPDPTDLVTTFPADSWLAFAASGVGDQISNSIAQFKAGFEAGLQDAAPNLSAQVDPIQMFQDATGLNLEEDLAWIGDVGGFVEGTSIFGLGGGLVVTTDDEQAAQDAVTKVQQAIGKSRGLKVTPSQDGFDIQAQGAPLGAQVAVEDDKVVVAAGADTVDDVLSPSETLGDSDTFQAAEDDLGDDLTPSFFINFAPILDLVDSTGQSDPDIESARPYLNALDFLIGGSKVDGDRSVAGFTLGVQDQPEGSDSTTSAVITP
ncbi:MAG: DUF3352 domain-containing protein [Solirubrobacterales bacterium]